MSTSHALESSVAVEGQTQENTRIDYDEIPGARFLLHSNLKIFTKAVTALSKLGSDLLLEPTEHGLSLRAVNKTKSGIGIFLFSNDFFSEADISKLVENKGVCRISMKCALTMFKGLQFGDKNYVSCQLWVEPSADHLVSQLTLAYDVLRTFEVNLLETIEPFRTNVDKTKLMNCSIAYAEALTTIVNMIRSNSEELIVCATAETFTFKNYCSKEDNNDFARRVMVQTEGNVSQEHFTRHVVRRPCELSFCLKEFMAILTFASQHSAMVSLYYDLPGSPMVVALEGDINYTCEFILATSDVDDVAYEEQRTVDTSRVVVSRHASEAQRQTTNEAGSSRSRREPSHAHNSNRGTSSTAVDNGGAPQCVGDPNHPQLTAEGPVEMDVGDRAAAAGDVDEPPVEQEDPFVFVDEHQLEQQEMATLIDEAPSQENSVEMADVHMEEPEAEEQLPPTPPPQASVSLLDKTVVVERVKRNKEFRKKFLSAETLRASQALDKNQTVYAGESGDEMD